MSKLKKDFEELRPGFFTRQVATFCGVRCFIYKSNQARQTKDFEAKKIVKVPKAGSTTYVMTTFTALARWMAMLCLFYFFVI